MVSFWTTLRSFRCRHRVELALVSAALALCILTSDPGPAGAQTVTATTGAVNGVVTDGTKAVVPGVIVSLAGPSLIAAQTTVTDQAGAYRFSAIPPGDYTLTFVLAGFATIVRDGVRVASASPCRSTPSSRRVLSLTASP